MTYFYYLIGLRLNCLSDWADNQSNGVALGVANQIRPLPKHVPAQITV